MTYLDILAEHEKHDERYDSDCPICQRTIDLAYMHSDSTGCDAVAIREFIEANTPAEVWCQNDASVAVAVVDGKSYCGTCYPFAVAAIAAEARAAGHPWRG